MAEDKDWSENYGRSCWVEFFSSVTNKDWPSLLDYSKNCTIISKFYLENEDNSRDVELEDSKVVELKYHQNFLHLYEEKMKTIQETLSLKTLKYETLIVMM
ncbi:hypothetical protein Fot_39767 [Forsythia ovata]|uniref:Uncharacterized protein n=1 Tax=Forsythia ovata TaxID=205694 RepID=A0ABD1S5P6_9LAMI